MVGDDLAGREDLLQRGTARAQRSKRLVGHEGIVDQHLVFIGAQALGDHAADHTGAQQAHADAVIAGLRCNEPLCIVAVVVVVAAHGLKAALARQHDLRDGVLGHGHRVCRPRGEHAHAARQEGACEGLHRARAVEQDLQIGKDLRDALLRQRRHAPGGQQHAHVLDLLRARRERLLRQHAGQQVEQFVQPLPHAFRVDPIDQFR